MPGIMTSRRTKSGKKVWIFLHCSFTGSSRVKPVSFSLQNIAENTYVESVIIYDKDATIGESFGIGIVGSIHVIKKRAKVQMVTGFR